MRTMDTAPKRRSMHIPANLATLAAVALLAGCSLVPPAPAPEIEVPARFRQAALDGNDTGSWKPAEPAEQAARGEWWKLFGDAQLDALIEQARRDSPTLASAAARVRQARALAGVARADRVPRVDAGIGAQRGRSSPASLGLKDGADVSPQSLYRAPLSISWELDLFGRIAANVEAAGQDANAAQAAYRSVDLVLLADIAQTWFALRETDAETGVLRKTVALRSENVRLLQARYDAGDIGEIDLARARAELAVTQSEAAGLERTRAALEHALAVLTGRAPGNVEIAAAPLATDLVLPVVPPGLPSALLERRPDVVAAQHAMLAANARIGVAKAAFFPALPLTGALGYESGELSNLFQWSTRTWLIGGLLSMPIFDGGRNRANLERSEAALEQSVADYRNSVLQAFAEVEDSLAGLRVLSTQAARQAEARAASERALQLADARYRNGYTSYFEVIDAQRALLAAQRAETQIRGARAGATVALIRALGGGWEGAYSPVAQR
jgi:multidrug efflux system outer membrane protein